MDVFDAISPAVVEWVVIAVVGLVAAYFLLTPLLILQILKLEAQPQVILFDPAEKKPPPDVLKYYATNDRQLKMSGFEQLAGVLMPSPLPNVRVLLWLYVHRSNRDVAMISCLWGMADPGNPLKTRYVEILSEYEEGNPEQILTNNNDEVGAFPDPPTHLISRMPQVKQADLLYRYHQRIVRREGLEGGKLMAVLDRYDGDVARYLQEKVLGGEYERQVRNGYLRLTRSGRYYKPTFLGAYPMTWKNLSPMKEMIQGRYRRSGQKLETELRAEG